VTPQCVPCCHNDITVVRSPLAPVRLVLPQCRGVTVALFLWARLLPQLLANLLAYRVLVELQEMTLQLKLKSKLRGEGAAGGGEGEGGQGGHGREQRSPGGSGASAAAVGGDGTGGDDEFGDNSQLPRYYGTLARAEAACSASGRVRGLHDDAAAVAALWPAVGRRIEAEKSTVLFLSSLGSQSHEKVGGGCTARGGGFESPPAPPPPARFTAFVTLAW
jgi:hypothetical protein